MQRQVPEFKAVRLKPSPEPMFEVEMSVVTPMFGGSAEPGEVDRELPVSGKTIRGHLRFWWRACVAHRYDSAERLFEDEAEIWGATSGDTGIPAKVDVEVEIRNPGLAFPSDNETLSDRQWQRDDDFPAYALFPFQKKTNQPARRAQEDVSFILRLIPAAHVTDAQEIARLRSQVHAALWAWLTFGGVGARTRRGCGTLWTNNPEFCPPANEPILEWLTTRARKHLQSASVETPLPIPTLNGATILVHPQKQVINEAWRNAVNWLRDYRQRRTGGRRGRSLWPEADTIRALWNSTTGSAPPSPTRLYFPRGELGLPIIFHFKDSGDPPDHTLQAAVPGATRMASPIITKALAVNNQHGIPLVLLFRVPLLHQLGVPVEVNGQQVTVYDRQLAHQVAPLRQHRTDNPVNGFLAYLRQEKRLEELTLG